LPAGLNRLTNRSDRCEDNADYIKTVDSSLNQRCSNSAGTKLIGCLLARVGHKDLYQFGTHTDRSSTGFVCCSVSTYEFNVVAD